VLETPWVPVLTIAFLATGLLCTGALVIRRRATAGAGELSDNDLIDINHSAMSAAMILMAWVMMEGVVAWAQIAIFAICAVSLLPAYRRAGGAPERVGLLGHIGMNVAMIWMLAAMPTLMSEMATGDGSGSGHSHGAGGSGAAPMPTPAWADATNAVFVALSVAAALWWLYRAATTAGHRLHQVSYAVMAAGMGTMLLVMNG
jgi:Domain of unknown function (DUF5134)